MANGHNGSRSPVRALDNIKHPHRLRSAHRLRSWGDSTAHELAPAPRPAFEGTLTCPDCGSSVRLALVSASNDVGEAGSAPRAVPEPVSDNDSLPDFDRSVRRYKRELIARALDDNDGVMTRAAKALGLKYTTFVAMVHRLGMSPSENA